MDASGIVKNQILDSGKAGGAINPGTMVRVTTSVDGITQTFISATSGIGSGVALGVRTGGGTQVAYASGDEMMIAAIGSECLAFLAGAVSNLALPLMATTGGKFTPVTADKDAYFLIPLETGSANSYIRCVIAPGYYAA